MAEKGRPKKKVQTVKGRNIFYFITSRTVLAVMAVMLVFSYVSSYINPARCWLLSIFGLCFVALALLNLILMLWALKRRSKSFLIPFIALLPSLFYTERYVNPFPDKPDGTLLEDGKTLKLVTYNVGRFSGEAPVSKEECADDIFAYLKLNDPDVVCLQEVWVRDIRKLAAYFKSRMPGYYFRYCMAQGRSGHFGNVTFSKLPIVKSGRLKFEKSANMAIYTDLKSGGEVFRVYNCHFESYNISLPHIVKALTSDKSDVIRETGSKLEASISRRPQQVDKVLRDISQCDADAVVCGDFNDTPMSYTYNRLMKGRKDAFIEAGSGFGATYSVMWPALRIDYALLPENYDIVSFDIPKVGYSDHYPTITNFQI